MREIKYRAWHKKEREMFTVAHLHFGIDGMLHIATTSVRSDAWVVEDIELMQFTGLLDKKGKEIYEGDILRVMGNYVSYGTHNAAVEWSDRELGWSTSSGLKMLHHSGGITELEIIGNIYEHPQLVEAKS